MPEEKTSLSKLSHNVTANLQPATRPVVATVAISLMLLATIISLANTLLPLFNIGDTTDRFFIPDNLIMVLWYAVISYGLAFRRQWAMPEIRILAILVFFFPIFLALPIQLLLVFTQEGLFSELIETTDILDFITYALIFMSVFLVSRPSSKHWFRKMGEAPHKNQINML